MPRPATRTYTAPLKLNARFGLAILVVLVLTLIAASTQNNVFILVAGAGLISLISFTAVVANIVLMFMVLAKDQQDLAVAHAVFAIVFLILLLGLHAWLQGIPLKTGG